MLLLLLRAEVGAEGREREREGSRARPAHCLGLGMPHKVRARAQKRHPGESCVWGKDWVHCLPAPFRRLPSLPRSANPAGEGAE